MAVTADPRSPSTVITEALLSADRHSDGLENARAGSDAVVQALGSAGWLFVAADDLQRLVEAEAELERLKADDGPEDSVERPVHRPGYPLYPAFMQTLITYMGALDGAVKALVESEGDEGTGDRPYLGEIPVLYYGEQIGVITDEDGLGHSFRFTPRTEGTAP